MNKSFFSLALLLMLTACATTEDSVKPEAEAVVSGCAATEASTTGEPVPRVNDFPTRDRVDYVLECIAKHGGLTYINQYACGCKIDKIAEKLSFEEYEAARTFVQMQKTPGENGAPFRDPQQSKDLRGKLKQADDAAEKACFVK